MNMENIKYYFNLWINRYCDFLLNFLMNWLHHSPLKTLDEGYLYFVAGTLSIIITLMLLIPVGELMSSVYIFFSPGNTFKEKFRSYIRRRKIRTLKYRKNWPNSFLYKYLIQMSYISFLIPLIGSILLKSLNILYIGLPYLAMIIVHNKKVMTKFNYKLKYKIDFSLYIISVYISLFLLVHFLVNYNLI